MPGPRLLGLGALAGAGFVFVMTAARVALADPPAAAAAPSPTPSASTAPSGERAAGTAPAGPNGPPGDDGLVPEEMPNGGIPPGSIVWHPWRLFDPYLSPRSTVLTGGPAWERFIDQGYEHRGFEVTLGRSIETPAHPLPFLARLELEFGVRVTNPSHWVLSLARYSYAGAIALGPVELSGRAGATLGEVHFGSSGFGVGLFAPRVSAGASISVGPVRVGAVAFTEYEWRWIGGPSALVQGVLLEIALGHSPDGLPPYYRIKN